MNSEHHRLVAWRGTEPRRIDVAHLWLGEDRLTAHGSSTSADCVVTYRVDNDPQWMTTALEVRVDDADGWRSLALRRHQNRGWSATRCSWQDPSRWFEIELPDLDGALDCDLGLCPVTNTMPVRREGILAASQRHEPRYAELLMAWVAVPELIVTASPQRYDAGTPIAGGGAQIRFASGGFVEHIEVDADGVVVSYPSIGNQMVA